MAAPVLSASLDRKARLIADIAMKNYDEPHLPDQYEFELNLAYKMLSNLGVKD